MAAASSYGRGAHGTLKVIRAQRAFAINTSALRNTIMQAPRGRANLEGEMSMLRFISSTLVAAALVTAPLAVHAQDKAKTETSKSAKKAKEPSKSQSEARERQKQCGEEWRDAKKAGKIEKGQTWPKFWSACNKRLKEKQA